MLRGIIICSIALVLVGCHREPPIENDVEGAGNTERPDAIAALDSRLDRLDADEHAKTPAEKVATTDSWIGRWSGPEGQFLEILPRNGRASGVYTVVVKDSIAAQSTLPAMGKDETIVFSRRGVQRVLRAGSGKETGVEQLADKTDCLIVIRGREGYCRG